MSHPATLLLEVGLGEEEEEAWPEMKRQEVTKERGNHPLPLQEAEHRPNVSESLVRVLVAMVKNNLSLIFAPNNQDST